MSKSNPIMTVSTLLSLYPNSLSSTLDGKLLVLEGFYSDNQNKLYGQFYYDEIIAKEKKYRITIQINHELKTSLTAGGFYNFEGYMNRGTLLDNDSRLKVYFRVTKILEQKKEVPFISELEYDIIQARFNRAFPIIQEVLLKKLENQLKPTIDIITGIQSTSKEDYSNQLIDSAYFDIQHHTCNMASPVEILKFIDSMNFQNTDLVIVLRGGGSGLEVFDSIELCKKMIELPVPFITGIGHEADKPLLQKVADKAFSTPTAVGVFLQQVVTNYKNGIQIITDKDKEIERLIKASELNNQKFENRLSQQRRYLILLAIVFIVFIFILLFVLKIR